MPINEDIESDYNTGKIIYADDDASSLLAGRLGEFTCPGDQWELVKRNSSRSVWRGKLEGKKVYLKQFHSKSFWHRLAGKIGLGDARVEFNFMQYLSGIGIPTAKALAVASNNGTHWLLSREVAPAVQLDHWHEQQIAGGKSCLKNLRLATVSLGKLLGKMHAGGVVHGDLHCGNLMVKQKGDSIELVLMDLHRARKRRYLSRRLCAKNLSHLFHDRYFLTTRTDRIRFLRAYLSASKVGGSLRGWVMLIEHFAKRHTTAQNAQRDRRIDGNNKYFRAITLEDGWRGSVILASKRKLGGSDAADLVFKKEDWVKVLADPKSLFDGDDVEVVKSSRSGVVARRKLQIGPHEVDVYIKRPKRKYLRKIVFDIFRPSRPTRAFRLGHALLARRIATALPLAALERRTCGFLLDSILITEAVDAPVLKGFLETWLGDATTGDRSLTKPQQRNLAQQVLCQLGELLRRLHDNHFAHRDLKATNILVSWSPDAQPKLVLIDLDGLKQTIVVSTRKQYQGLMRLNVSLLRCLNVNHAGRLRMLLGYLRRPGCGKIVFKPYWRVLEKWSARKLKAQIKSRRKKQRAKRKPLT